MTTDFDEMPDFELYSPTWHKPTTQEQPRQTRRKSYPQPIREIMENEKVSAQEAIRAFYGWRAEL